jgi:hypothetical protein
VGKVPDPRVAGPQIFFDSRMDMPKDKLDKDPFVQAMGDKQKKVGSVMPS